MKKSICAIVFCLILILFCCSAASTNSFQMKYSGIIRPWHILVMTRGFIDPEGQVLCTENGYTYEFSVRGNGRIDKRTEKFHESLGISLPTSEYVENHVIEGRNYLFWEPDLVERKPIYYLEALIKQDDRYVGYAAIAEVEFKGRGIYVAQILECKMLPEEDTETVLTAEYLRKQIDKAIEKYEPYILKLYSSDEKK